MQQADANKTGARVLVTGATGNIGRSLVEFLRQSGAHPVAVSRKTGSAGLPPGVDVVEGDPSRPTTITHAMRGASALFVNPLAVQGATADLLALAREHGITRVVALSATNVHDDPATQPSLLRGADHRMVEKVLEASRLETVILRCSVHAANSLAMWGPQIQRGDVVFWPYAASVSAPLHERDVAAVAASLLTTRAPVSQRVVITGPESLTQSAMVTAIGATVGRRLRLHEVPPDVAKRAMVERGLPEPLVVRILALLARGLEERPVVTDEVERILGRPAKTFGQWVVDRADAFRLAATGTP
jgi:uncharacterized protein YbjT (DUF2867 family)